MFPDVRKSVALYEDFKASPVCPSDKSNSKMKMSMEQWYNDAGRGQIGVLAEKHVLLLLRLPNI